MCVRFQKRGLERREGERRSPSKQILNESKLLMVASNSVAARVNAGKPCYVLGILLITQMQLHVSLAHTGVLEFTYLNDGNIF